MATNVRKSDRTTAGASAPPPPGLMLQKMTAAPNPSSTILPPSQREARPLPGAGVPTAAAQMQLPPFQGRPQFQHQHHHPQQQQQQPPPPQPMQMQMHTMNNNNQNWNGGHLQQQHQQHRTPADTRPMNYNHNNTMLPPFLQNKSSSNTPQNASPMVSKQQQQQQHPNNPPPQYYAQPPPHFPLVRQQQQQPSRLYFCNPHPRAHPIAATTIPSSSMTPRDLTYVLHAMIRPTTLNPDNYYRMWMRSDLRQKDDDDSVTVRIEKQREFRRSVEERAREWKGEQQVLGHIVKSNVHRPRAMLDLEVSVHHHHAGGSAGNDDDATARATLWKARKLMDVGYGHLLDGRLEALRACVLGGNDDDDDHHNLTLLLTLPKGRTLVARTLAGMREQGTDDVVSLFRLMPLLVTRLFAHPVMREREDRLLFVCTSAVVTYGGDDSVLTLWIATLEAAMDTAAGDLKKVLGSRPRAEFMHALLTGGAGMCARNNNGPSEGRWKGAEERFLSMLSSQ